MQDTRDAGVRPPRMSTEPSPSPVCRFCATPLRRTFVDLGMSPLCQTHIEPHQLNHAEMFYPLHTYVCEKCYLVQLEQFVAPDEIFSDYAYFSSYSDSWVDHAKRYVEMAIDRFALNRSSLVIEIASNDGYLLQHFARRQVPCLGIEPAANVAAAAVATGGVAGAGRGWTTKASLQRGHSTFFPAQSGFLSWILTRQ